MSLLEAPSLIEHPPPTHPPSESAHCHGIVAPHKIIAPGDSNTNIAEFIHTCTVKHGTCCSKSQWWPPKPVSLLLACLNRHMSKHSISAPVMPKMARNRSALHDVLAQGAFNRDIMVNILDTDGLVIYYQITSRQNAEQHHNIHYYSSFLWSILVQVMFWCLVAPSHYLNQYPLVISEVPQHSPENK